MVSTAFERDLWGRLFMRVTALVLLGAALWSLVGPAEAVILTGAVAVVWTVASTVYAFAVGQLLFAVLFAAGVEGPLLTASILGSALAVRTLFVAAAVFGVLFVAEAAMRWPPSTVAAGVTTALLVWGGLSGVWLVEPPWHGAAALLVAFALLSYGIHRAELVTLGLVEEAET